MSVAAMNWAIENDRVKALPPTARHVLLVLANRANARTAEVFMAQETMADETSLSSTAVTTALVELKKRDFIQWTGEYRMRCKVLRLNLEDAQTTMPPNGNVTAAALTSTLPRPCRDVAATLPPNGNKPEPEPEPTRNDDAVNVPQGRRTNQRGKKKR